MRRITDELDRAFGADPEFPALMPFYSRVWAPQLEIFERDNKFFVPAYTDIMSRFNSTAQGKHSEYLAGRTKDDSFQGVFETFVGTARQMATEGKSPAEIATALRAKYQGNKDLLNIPYREQDKELLRAAQALAEEGHYDVVKEILQGERTAPDGTKLGSLANSRDLGRIPRLEPDRDLAPRKGLDESRGVWLGQSDNGHDAALDFKPSERISGGSSVRTALAW